MLGLADDELSVGAGAADQPVRCMIVSSTEISPHEVHAALMPWTQNYLWHNEAFELHSHQVERCPWLHKDDPLRVLWTQFYTDSLDDEHFAAWLLSVITTTFAGTVASITVNGDVQLLVTEAADYMPKWLDSSSFGGLDAIARNRIWIHHGQLHVVPRKRRDNVGTTGTPGSFAPGELSVDTAVAAVLDAEVPTGAPLRAQEHLARTLFSHYPARADESTSRVRVWLPAHTASILVQSDVIADGAASAFAERTPSDMQAAVRAAHVWPRAASGPAGAAPAPDLSTNPSKGHGISSAAPEHGVDVAKLVMCTVRMRRERAGWLHFSTFSAPRGWQLPEIPSAATDAAVLLGMKLALGLHMHAQALGVSLLRSGSGAASAGEGELKDLPEWHTYMAQLQRSGYFGGNLEASEEHRRLLAQARVAFRASDVYAYAVGRSKARTSQLQALVEQSPDMQAITRSQHLAADDPGELQQDAIARAERYNRSGAAETATLSQQAADDAPTFDASDVHTMLQQFASGKGPASSGGAQAQDGAFDLNPDNWVSILKSLVDVGEGSPRTKACPPVQSRPRDATAPASSTDDDSSMSGSSSAASTDSSSRAADDADEHAKGRRGAESANESEGDVVEAYGARLQEELADHGLRVATGSDAAPDVDRQAVQDILQSVYAEHGQPGAASALLAATGMRVPSNADPA